MADGERAPDPREVRDPAGFVAQLRALKDWSGLTCRALSERAEAVGDVLSPSTVANMLTRARVPREELVQAFVRACGAGPEALDHWLEVREELAVRARHGDAVGTSGAAHPSLGADGTADGDRPPPGASRWRAVVPVVAGAALVIAAVTVVAFVRGDGSGHRSPGAPEAGPVGIRVVHSGLCLGERRGLRSGQVYQVPCGGAVVPRYSLVPLDGGLWRLRSDHPDHGPGCSGIPVEAVEQDGAPLVDQECGKRGPRETFRIERFGGSTEGHRVRSAHSGLCLEVRDGSAEPWTDVVQRACDDGGEGQLFGFERR